MISFRYALTCMTGVVCSPISTALSVRSSGVSRKWIPAFSIIAPLRIGSRPRPRQRIATVSAEKLSCSRLRYRVMLRSDSMVSSASFSTVIPFASMSMANAA